MELDNLIKVRATNDLKNHLNILAQKNNMTPSQYVRYVIQDAYLNTLQRQTQTV